MNRKRLVQLRISHLLWVTLVVAAFFGGRQLSDSSLTQPAAPKTASLPALGSKPLAFDFATATTAQPTDSEVFSFYIGLSR